MQPSLSTSRTITIVAAALGLCTACFYIPPSHPGPPPPPDLVTLSADVFHFTAVVGQVSAPQHFSIANNSSVQVSINPQSQWISGQPKSNPFAIQTDCGLTLAAKASCVVTVTFRPTADYQNYVRLDLKFHGVEEHRVGLFGELTGAVEPAKP